MIVIFKKMACYSWETSREKAGNPSRFFAGYIFTIEEGLK
jgi:hypothetical protein